jgi:hypothetical protein
MERGQYRGGICQKSWWHSVGGLHPQTAPDDGNRVWFSLDAPQPLVVNEAAQVVQVESANPGSVSELANYIM